MLCLAGLFAFAQWQFTDDTGSAPVNPDLHDHLFGAGADASFRFVPGKFGMLARQTIDFKARDRFKGRRTALGLNFVF